MTKKTLCLGDNLDILRGEIADESVDLVYLDPPFNSKRDYNVIFKDVPGKRSTAQEWAFADTWNWTEDTERTYAYLVTTARNQGRIPPIVSTLIAALREGIGEGHLLAYLVEMAVRLVEMRRVLKPTGSLYLHCDPTASHYLKIILDAVFGPSSFVNEIIWKRSSAHSDARQGSRHFGRVSDTILFYAKGPTRTWNQLYTPYDPAYVERDYRRVDEDGRRYRISDLTANKGGGDTSYELLGVRPPKGRYWAYSKARMQQFLDEGRIVQTRPGAFPQYKRYLDEMPGMPVQNVWTDIPVINNRSREKLGYPTQKPLALLARIISASTNPGDVILDAFCGCGTAIIAAQELGRGWIGIDISPLAQTVMMSRIRDKYGQAMLDSVEMIHQPTDVEGARQLAESAPAGRHKFELWALGVIGARPLGGVPKRGADRGVDGVLTFTGARGKLETVIVSVKSGKVTSSMVRDLKGTVERERAALGVFLTLAEPTREMRREAATAGHYRSRLSGTDYPKLQILSIDDLLSKRIRPALPPYVLPSHPVAARVPVAVGVQQGAFLDETGQPIEQTPARSSEPPIGPSNLKPEDSAASASTARRRSHARRKAVSTG